MVGKNGIENAFGGFGAWFDETFVSWTPSYTSEMANCYLHNIS